MSKRRKGKHKTEGRGAKQGSSPQLSGIALLICETPKAVLDLHGLTGKESEVRVRDFFRTHAQISRGRVVHIITGKGTGSDGPAVLPKVVNQMLAGELDEYVAERAGLFGGGGIAVRLC